MDLGFTVHVLVAVNGNATEELTREFDTWEEAVEAMMALPDQLTTWQAITVYRTEDQPRMLLGAEPL